MKKVFLFTVVGLMSLLGASVLLSCDKSTFVEEEEFAPYGYYVKNAENIQVVGFKGLVIEEVSKTDWQLYVPYELLFIGKESLQIEKPEYDIIVESSNTVQVDVNTNQSPVGDQEQTISYAVGGLLCSYTYLGQEQKLMCLTPLKVVLKINIEETNKNTYFERGHVEFSLMANDNIVLVQKSVPYTVASVEYYHDYADIN